MGNPEIRRFVGRLFLFALPLFALLAAWAYLEIALAPALQWAWRPADHTVAGPLRRFLPGPLYPRQSAVWPADGDLGRGTPWNVRKQNLIQSDDFGYRNSRLQWDSYDVVVVGDSFAEGGPISQEDILPAVLGRRLGRKVYCFAGPKVDWNGFLSEKRFQSNPPKVVLVCFVERSLKNLPRPLAAPPAPGPLDPWLETWKCDRGFQGFVIAADRWSKGLGLDYLKWRMEGSPANPVSFQVGGPFLFYQGDGVVRDAGDDSIKAVVDRVEEYRKVLAARGIRLFFLPVPNKESVYYGFLKDKTRPLYLGKIVEGLKERHIETADLQTAFEKVPGGKDGYLYYTDDTHWNARGVRVAADLIAPGLRRLLDVR